MDGLLAFFLVEGRLIERPCIIIVALSSCAHVTQMNSPFHVHFAFLLRRFCRSLLRQFPFSPIPFSFVRPKTIQCWRQAWLRHLLFAILLFPLLLCSSPRTDRPEVHATRSRIISLAPSITETIYALNAEERLVGVTKFCAYPAEARKLPNVGGYVDPNYEAILRLKPDLVILLKEHKQVIDFLVNYNIPSQPINNQRLPDILQSFIQIGEICGKADEGKAMVRRIQDEFAYDSSLTGPLILLCVGRDGFGSGVIAKTWVAGPTTFYGELLAAAGARNAVIDSTPTYSTFSAEAILRIQPDVIIDLMASMAGIDSAVARKDWNSLSMSKAVREGMVFCLTGDYLTIPGPRILLTLRDLKKVVGEWRIKKKKL